MILAFVITGDRPAAAQSNRLITGQSAGNVRIGMTVGEARTAMRGYTFRRTTDGEGVALIEIRLRNQPHMTIYAGELDPAGPIDDNSRISFIEVWSSLYRTAAGVGPRMTVSSVESRYGRLGSIMLSEIESREFARFTNQPAGIDFRVTRRNGMAGIYGAGETAATRYSRTAYVLSIIVLGVPSQADGGSVPAPVFSSQYTDLGSQCRTASDQGAVGRNVSTYCGGYGGYQIHIFDTATTMEINVQSNDRSSSVHIASQSLRFDRNNNKIEWRFRDGVPFAVIMRGFKYRLGSDGLIRYPEVRTGEYLIVKGLPGYEQIDYEINVRSEGNPNEKARQMADEGYARIDGGNTQPNAPYRTVDINKYNRNIELANRNRESWTRSAAHVVVELSGEMQDLKTRIISFEYPSSELSNSVTAVITDDGLLDDSIRSKRLRLELRRDGAGVWKVTSAQESWACQQGRGHQDYSGVSCF